MKRTIISLLLVICLSFPVFAAQNRVIDDAGLLTDSQAVALENRIEQLTDLYNVDIVIVTVDSIGDRSATDYADDYYDSHGYGIGSNYSGILLLISVEYRDWAISTCGDAIDIFSDRAVDNIFSRMSGTLSQGEYYQAFINYLDTLVPYLDGEQISHRSAGFTIQTFLICLAIGAAVGGIILLIMRGQMNTAKAQRGANSYMRGDTYSLNRHTDLFLYSSIHKTRKADTGSSIHSSGSGRIHGGRSGKF